MNGNFNRFYFPILRFLKRIGYALTLKVWIVSEECHGDVSYWITMRGAEKEALRIVLGNCGDSIYDQYREEYERTDKVPAAQIKEWKGDIHTGHWIDGAVNIRCGYLNHPWR